MITITTTEGLAAFCERARTRPYVTVDTEFLRERTYYSKLCLLQLAIPGDAEEDAVLVDPIAGKLSLEPLYELFRDESVVKVFHAARQDLEIFFVEGGVIPKPLFDTQVAAMVAGFGEQVGYETLVRKIAKANARQVLALHRLVAAAAVGRAEGLCAGRRDASAADLRIPRQGAEEVRPRRLGRGGTRRPHRSRDLRHRSGGGVAAGSRPARIRAGSSPSSRNSRGSARSMRGTATSRGAGSTRTTRCWNWPRPSRAVSMTSTARAFFCARRGRARSPTASSRRCGSGSRCRPTRCPSPTRAATSFR